MKTVTQWFYDKKPAHIGVYQRKYKWEIQYSMWDGRCFLWAHPTAKGAASELIASNTQHLPWRGLAEEPTK